MPKVIDGDTLIKDFKRLPTEAFFVDTNIIIDFKDPFSATYKNTIKEKVNNQITQLLSTLKSAGIKSYTTFSVALEYYKYIQVNAYKVYKTRSSRGENLQFNPEDFKALRENDLQFISFWGNYMESFKKTFRKNFKIIDKLFDAEIILDDFKGTNYDFGDHLLYESAKTDLKHNCIFTNDSDFYSIDDDNLYFITFNNKIINNAKTDSNLLN